MKRQGKRTDFNFGSNDPKLSAQIIGDGMGISSAQVKRYIRLTELIPELLDMVDAKRIQFTIAVESLLMSTEYSAMGV